MDKEKYYHNPYDFISPVRDPELFAGRHDELKEIEYYLQLSKNDKPKYFHLALVGPRSAGKTSLLNMIGHVATNLRLLSVKIALNAEIVKNDVLFFKEVFDGIITKGAEKGLYGGITGKVYRTYRKVIDTLDIKAEAKVPFLFGGAYIGFKKNENTGIPQHVLLHDLKKMSSEAKNADIPTIVLLFDECDLIAQNEVLLQKIRNVFMEIDGYILVFSGTENMFPAISNVFSPIPRFFKRVNVDNFKNVKETEECLLKPLNEEDKKDFDNACIGEIHGLTNGTPYEINLVAHYMYRRWKDGKNPKIGLSPEVLDDVLNEIERLRQERHHAIANKIRSYWIDYLKALISLLEFPKVTKEWLAEFMMLEELDTLQPKDIYSKKSINSDYIERLKKDNVIAEEDGKLSFNGGQFDLLYLKYFCASKGVRDTKDFFMGLPEDPMWNLYHKIVENILVKGFEEYNIQAAFDKKEKIEGKTAQKFIIGARVANLPPGTHTILEISPKTREEFYLGAANSVRFRINVGWMKDGFVTQVKFKKEEDREKFQSRLKSLTDKLDVLGYKILMEDEMEWNNRGTEFLKQGKIIEAVECFDKAIQINPSFELPWANKAKIFMDAKKHEEALECANKALELHRSWEHALKLKGMILINLGRNEEALEYLGKALEMNPEDSTTWDNKARALANLGRYNEAIECADKSLKTNPANPQLLSIKGLALTNLGRNDKALACFDEALGINPGNTIALLAKGHVLLNRGDCEGALGCFDVVLEKESGNIDALILKGFALYKLSRYEEAIGCCDRVIQVNKTNATGWYNKACFEAKIGHTGSALKSLHEAIQIEKKFALEAKGEEDFASLKNDERFLSVTDLVWYASYGSNLYRKRFMCYIEGGQPDGASRPNPGCRDKTPPKDDKPRKIPYALYFAKQSSRWDNKGVAFIGLKKEETNMTLGRMYLITKQQFIDVVSQENNGAKISVDLQKAKEKGSMVFHESLYGNIVYLGDEYGFPVYTFTSCTDIALEDPVAPSPKYLKNIILGLKEAYKLPNEDILKYLITKSGIKDFREEGLLSIINCHP